MMGIFCGWGAILGKERATFQNSVRFQAFEVRPPYFPSHILLKHYFMGDLRPLSLK